MWPYALPRDDPRHGTQNGYGNRRCRCDSCRAANTAYMRDGGYGRYQRDACPVCGAPKVVRSEVCRDCYHATVRAEHGSPAMWRHGCRCARCTGHQTKVRAEYRRLNQVPCADCGTPVEGKGRPNSRSSNRGRVPLDPNRPHLCRSCALKRNRRTTEAAQPRPQELAVQQTEAHGTPEKSAPQASDRSEV